MVRALSLRAQLKRIQISNWSFNKNALAAGYRSGLEFEVQRQLEQLGVQAEYESVKLAFVKPARDAKYTPDFVLPNGIIIETKGQFVVADRQKHILLMQQHPLLDIRFVFSNPRSRIGKGSKTTYEMWCIKHNFHYAKKLIPEEWIEEPHKQERFDAITAAAPVPKTRGKKT